MSFNTSSSFFSPVDDTFINRKNRNILTSRNNNDDGEYDDFNERSIYPETSLSHNLTLNQVSPYMPIKTLIESPFKPVHAQSTPFKNLNQDNAESNLKLKIKAHQRQFHDSINNMQSDVNFSAKPINKETYLNSVFNSRRSINNSNINNNNNNDKNLSHNNIIPLEPLRNSNLNNKNKFTTDSKNSKHTLAQDLDNPYFNEAVGRIVNKEFEIRKLLFGILTFLIYRFFRSIIRLFVYTNPIFGNTTNNISHKIELISENISNENMSKILKFISLSFSFDNILKIGHYIELIFISLFSIILITSIYRILKPQDKCLDLPLTVAQRKILGLTLDERKDIKNEEYEDELAMKKLLSASSSPERAEKPTRIVMPDYKGLDAVMGSLTNLAINNNNNNNSISNNNNKNNNNNIKRDLISPKGKYMFDINNDLRNQSNYNSNYY